LDSGVVGDLPLDGVDLALRLHIVGDELGELVLLHLLNEEAEDDAAYERAEDTEQPELRGLGAWLSPTRRALLGQ
jgi:hypothetical protein